MNAKAPIQNQPIATFDVAVLGAGFAGIGAAIKLLEAGFTNFAVFEKATEVGGVWRENTYPGCACDVPSSLYSYSFAPNPHWSRVFARQAEIKTYLERTAINFGVMPYIRFGHEMHEAVWDDAAKHWVIHTSKGIFHARFTIMAGGPMHEPVYPKIKGLKEFKGTLFHSARWNHDINLTGKRVAVIGAGASAIQFVPEIQPKVAKLTLIQRTPQWVLPKMDPSLPRPAQILFDRLPVALKLLRGGVYGVFESLNSSAHHPVLISKLERIARWNINHSIKDKTLRKKLTPDFTLGCKRILQSNNWYPALAQANVEVLRTGVQEIRGNTIITADGSQHEVDVIILGTGFEISNPPIARQIRGVTGQTMDEVWQGSPIGYLGTMTAGCPNGFIMFGPNIAVSSSAIIIIEAQLAFIMDALKKARRDNIMTLEVDPQRQAQYNAEIQKALAGTVWNTGGCKSYFIDVNGRNSTLWPWTTFEMRRRLATCELKDFIINRDISPENAKTLGVVA